MAIFQALAILEKPHLLRRAITRLVNETLPAAPEGGQRLIGAAKLPDLLRRSDRWLRLASAAVDLSCGAARRRPGGRWAGAAWGALRWIPRPVASRLCFN